MSTADLPPGVSASAARCCAAATAKETWIAERRYRVGPGRPLPVGVHDCCDGFNFALFSRHAERVQLLIFESPSDPQPALTIDLDPVLHRTGDIWHALIDGVSWGQAYAYRVRGPKAPGEGHRFDERLALLDPCAFALGRLDEAAAGSSSFSGPQTASGDYRRGLLINRRFDWQGVIRPKTPWAKTIVYETHVRGLTIHPSAGAAHSGTYLGVIEKIPHFLDLGITAVELMPVQAFDAASGPPSNGPDGPRLPNYWGYQPIAFFAPHADYASGDAIGSEVSEFKMMVRELHRSGIEVILDIVFNHTAEGGEDGPMFNFRGLDNSIYYLLEADRRRYADFSGCGNTINCNHPVVRDYLMDCLRYWATEMQVDGFRFDLASVLGRNGQGRLMSNPPLLERIAEDPILRDVKLIAEAWDLGGAYQVGSFAGQRWAEWNGRFRDDVRRFWRGDHGMTGAFASRLCGSADLYQRAGKQPVNSLNFVTCHDGFTLNDLVSYARSHNEANGDDAAAGAAESFSANGGIEGPSCDPAIEAFRIRQIKNMLATLFLSRGVPMLLGGDEFRRSQKGNTNAYCQDNELSWYDWGLVERNREIVRFVRELIALRRRHAVLATEAFFAEGEIDWFGPFGLPPDWDGGTRALGCQMRSQPATSESSGRPALCLLFNASSSRVEFRLPAPEGHVWHVELDTGRDAPKDVRPPVDIAPAADRGGYALGSHTLAVLAVI